MTIRILVTDRNLAWLGDPITDWREVDCTARFNEPGSGSFTAAARPDLMERIRPGNRIVVIRDKKIFMAGPIEKDGPYNWSVTGEHSDPGTITVRFADDLALVAGRVTYPDPTQPATAQTAQATWSTTAPAGTIITDLANVNAGPGALPARRIPGLVIGAGAGLGLSIPFSTRLKPLCDELRSAAIAGGGLGFRTRQHESLPQIVFEAFAPEDKTATVRFSARNGTLRSYTHDPEAPTATAALVGGQGEGTARTLRERLNTSAIAEWWRLETFIDRRSTDATAELDQAGDEALVDGAATARLSAIAVEGEGRRYGTDVNLGDKVANVLANGSEVIDIVRSAHLQATPESGEQVTFTVGSQAATTRQAQIRQLREIIRRLDRLETI